MSVGHFDDSDEPTGVLSHSVFRQLLSTTDEQIVWHAMRWYGVALGELKKAEEDKERLSEVLRAIVAMGDPENYVQGSTGQSRLEWDAAASHSMASLARTVLPQEEEASLG